MRCGCPGRHRHATSCSRQNPLRMPRVLVRRDTVEHLLTMDAVVNAMSTRHPEVFGGSLWRDLLLALDALRVDVGTRA